MVGPDLCPNCLTLCVPERLFLKKLILKTQQTTAKNMKINQHAKVKVSVMTKLDEIFTIFRKIWLEISCKFCRQTI